MMDGSSKKDLPGPQPTETDSEQQIKHKKPRPTTMPDTPSKITSEEVSEAYAKDYKDAVEEIARESAHNSPATSQRSTEPLSSQGAKKACSVKSSKSEQPRQSKDSKTPKQPTRRDSSVGSCSFTDFSFCSDSDFEISDSGSERIFEPGELDRQIGELERLQRNLQRRLDYQTERQIREFGRNDHNRQRALDKAMRREAQKRSRRRAVPGHEDYRKRVNEIMEEQRERMKQNRAQLQKFWGGMRERQDRARQQYYDQDREADEAERYEELERFFDEVEKDYREALREWPEPALWELALGSRGQRPADDVTSEPTPRSSTRGERVVIPDAPVAWPENSGTVSMQQQLKDLLEDHVVEEVIAALKEVERERESEILSSD